MKKLLWAVVLSLFIFNLSVFAQNPEITVEWEDWIQIETTSIEISDTENPETTIQTEEWLEVEEINIDLAETNDWDYTYFYAEWCTYCVKLDEFLTANNAYDKFNITKVDVRETPELMTQASEDVWIPMKDIGTPFVVVDRDWTKEWLVWLDIIREEFENQLLNQWEEIKEYEAPIGQKSIIKYILLALWAILLVWGIAYYNKK